jgi:hypothetical protein
MSTVAIFADEHFPTIFNKYRSPKKCANILSEAFRELSITNAKLLLTKGTPPIIGILLLATRTDFEIIIPAENWDCPFSDTDQQNIELMIKLCENTNKQLFIKYSENSGPLTAWNKTLKVAVQETIKDCDVIVLVRSGRKPISQLMTFVFNQIKNGTMLSVVEYD